jgi:hypothetical protein
MRLLSFSEHDDFGVEVATEAALLKPFKALISRDKTRGKGTANKLRAKKELAYIFFYCDTFESQYSKMDPDMRHEELMQFLELEKDPREDPVVQEAMEYYVKITKTKFEELLEAAYLAIDSIQHYFQNFDIDAVDDDGKPLYKITDLVNTLGKLGGVVEQVDKLMDQVQKQKLKTDKLRKNVEVDAFSE